MSYVVDATVDSVDERSTPDIEAYLVDINTVPIPGSVLLSLTLTYFQEYTQAIINARDAQNVLQANGVTVDEAGKLVWRMTTLDTAIVNDALEMEPHIAHFAFTYPDGMDTRAGSVTIRVPVANLVRVS